MRTPSLTETIEAYEDALAVCRTPEGRSVLEDGLRMARGGLHTSSPVMFALCREIAAGGVTESCTALHGIDVLGGGPGVPDTSGGAQTDDLGAARGRPHGGRRDRGSDRGEAVMTYDNPSVEEPADEDEIDHDLLRKQRIEDELAWGNL